MKKVTTPTKMNLLRMIYLSPPCKKCGEIVSVEKFCTNCGTENPQFKAREFQQVMGLSYKQAREECAAGHLDVKREMRRRKETRRLIEERPYCEVCGQNLLA